MRVCVYFYVIKKKKKHKKVSLNENKIYTYTNE